MGSFSTEPDYENGTWIDGEFYSSGTSKRRRSKHDQIYGIFGSDSEDEGAGGRDARDARPAADKPVAFVAGGTKPSTKEKPSAKRGCAP